jgi:hypothetical protein
VKLNAILEKLPPPRVVPAEETGDQADTGEHDEHAHAQHVEGETYER